MKKQPNVYRRYKISVVIPAYKAEKIIEKTLTKVFDVLDATRYDFEIICVVDGKVDRTWQRALAFAKKHKQTKVVGYEENLGKGHAVRFGMAIASGDIIGFIDAGLDINPNGISMLLEHFEWYGADIIVGSKRHPASKVTYPFLRKIISFGYQMIVRIFFGLVIRDTQVGLKFYRRQVLEKVLPRVLVKEFAFDIEMLAVANFLGFKRIYEAPVELDMSFGNSISSVASKGFIKTSFKVFWDTLAVFYRLNVLRYYDDRNKENWITPKYLKLTNR